MPKDYEERTDWRGGGIIKKIHSILCYNSHLKSSLAQIVLRKSPTFRRMEEKEPIGHIKMDSGCVAIASLCLREGQGSLFLCE